MTKYQIRTSYFCPLPKVSVSRSDMIIKLCFGGVSSRGWPAVSSAAADFPLDVGWTISRDYTVLFLSRDVKNIIFNKYLPLILTLLNVCNSSFRKLVLFWMLHHHGMALCRHDGGAWHNGLFLTTTSNVNCWAELRTMGLNVSSGWYGKFWTLDHGLA